MEPIPIPIPWKLPAQRVSFHSGLHTLSKESDTLGIHAVLVEKKSGSKKESLVIVDDDTADDGGGADNVPEGGIDKADGQDLTLIVAALEGNEDE